ncbi:UNVERIFIED_CONTAM: G-type lectin S-receptor-like serine/threonine-protein kinase [Sesamum indicum]
MNKPEILKLLLQSVFLVLCLPFQGFSAETDTITSSLSIKDPDFIVSRGQVFKLGFFTPDNTRNRYLGVFYTVSEKSVIWVANRDRPLTDSSGIVTISRDGNLVLMNGKNETVWSTNATTSSPLSAAAAQIQDNGNLVLRDVSTGNLLWDCFSHPSKVFVPTMRLIDDTNTGNKVMVSAWKNESDPEVGNFTAGLQALNIPQIFSWHNGRPLWRSGPWNGQILIGVQDMYLPYLDPFSLVNQSGIFYFTAPPGKVLMNVVLNSSGTLQQRLWDNQKKSWDIIWVAPQNECDIYGKCGPFGSCNQQGSPICSCLTGFEPVNKDEWSRGNWTSGCFRRTQTQCDRSNDSGSDRGDGDGFLRLQFMKVPDFPERFPSSLEDECRSRCLRNCSCIAYAHEPNIGCMFWSERLIDVQKFPGVGVDLHIRLAASELDKHKDKKVIIIIATVVAFVSISIGVLIAWCWMAKKRGDRIKDQKTSELKQAFSSDSTAIVLKDESEKVNLEELPLFTFETLSNATNQFDEENMLGKGGFGPVYKGKLPNGQEIAVKRLARSSNQGLEEFMNEVEVISRLQHRNLVRLLGCCVDHEEKMLVYEYMPNGSLDSYLFDSHKQLLLDWQTRIVVIEGICRGLLYLHRDSRLRIIHRDLKASNILLDEELNPKISDFGMARIFCCKEDQANTTRVVGTYGYMPPEYALRGIFSEKSDVYSFGVLLLEILSGRRNTSFYHEDQQLFLIAYAWKLWNEDKIMNLVDPIIYDPRMEPDVVRYANVGLLCVQEAAADRPNTKTVLSMLSSEIVELPRPKQPPFTAIQMSSESECSQMNPNICSVTNFTVRIVEGR